MKEHCNNNKHTRRCDNQKLKMVNKRIVIWDIEKPLG